VRKPDVIIEMSEVIGVRPYASHAIEQRRTGVNDRATRQAADEGSSDAHRWKLEYEEFRHTRLNRVQTSAGIWLGVLTTLFTVAGSFVLVKGSNFISGVTGNVGLRWISLLFACLVFATAVLGIIAGAAATWGGLGDPGRPGDGRPWTWITWIPPLIVFFAFKPRRSDNSKPVSKPGEDGWIKYRDQYDGMADRRRIYLRASRNLGVIAAAWIGVLTFIVLVGGVISPAPTHVIVVHRGSLTCGSVASVEKYTGITQVIVVDHC
jgi:hypothetical protein